MTVDLETLQDVEAFKFKAGLAGHSIARALEIFGEDAKKSDVFKFLGIPSSVGNYCLKQRSAIARLAIK